MRFAACAFGPSMPRTTCEDRLTFAPGFKQLALAYERSSVRTLVDIAVVSIVVERPDGSARRGLGPSRGRSVGRHPEPYRERLFSWG